MLKAKVLVIGPPKCGKTVLSNFLSDATENIGTEYRPTKGVRIVEFESRNLTIKGQLVVDAFVVFGYCRMLMNADAQLAEHNRYPCYRLRRFIAVFWLFIIGRVPSCILKLISS